MFDFFVEFNDIAYINRQNYTLLLTYYSKNSTVYSFIDYFK